MWCYILHIGISSLIMISVLLFETLQKHYYPYTCNQPIFLDLGHYMASISMEQVTVTFIMTHKIVKNYLIYLSILFFYQQSFVLFFAVVSLANKSPFLDNFWFENYYVKISRRHVCVVDIKYSATLKYSWKKKKLLETLWMIIVTNKVVIKLRSYLETQRGFRRMGTYISFLR